MKKIALIGNPNVGKTTLFNSLTGSREKVGNWTGVTVECVEMPFKRDKNVRIADLPGIYSLEPSSLDGKVVIDFIKREKIDLIVNVVDGMNLERNLNLTFDLLSLRLPTVLAVNFSDDCEKNGYIIDYGELSEVLGIPVIPISAKKNKTLSGLTDLFYKGIKKAETAKLSLSDTVKRVLKRGNDRGQAITERIDKVLLNKYFSLLFFFFVIFCVYFLSLKVGGVVSSYISERFDGLCLSVREKLTASGKNEMAVSFLTVAIFGGVGQVVSFLPQLLILFCLLSLIEESGYMSRVAFIFDRLFRGVGINGKSVFPLVLSMGCTVTGVMATRTIENDLERERTIAVLPFIPCGAKLIVFAWGAKVFFGNSPLIALSLFVISVIVAMIVGRLLLKREKEKSDFILEMPLYRLPSLKNTFFVVVEKLKDFIFRAGSIIFTVSIVYWFLTCFGINGYNHGNLNDSFLYYIGNCIKYLFYPIGFYDWKISSSLISGIFARETVIESLSICTTDVTALFGEKIYAFSFLCFVMLSPPCIATLSTCYNELKSFKKLLKMICLEFAVAYSFCFVLHILSLGINCPIYLILSVIVAIMIIGLRYLIKRKGEIKRCER